LRSAWRAFICRLLIYKTFRDIAFYNRPAGFYPKNRKNKKIKTTAEIITTVRKPLPKKYSTTPKTAVTKNNHFQKLEEYLNPITLGRKRPIPQCGHLKSFGLAPGNLENQNFLLHLGQIMTR
jgi:hypothetical protein